MSNYEQESSEKSKKKRRYQLNAFFPILINLLHEVVKNPK